MQPKWNRSVQNKVCTRNPARIRDDFSSFDVMWLCYESVTANGNIITVISALMMGWWSKCLYLCLKSGKSDVNIWAKDAKHNPFFWLPFCDKKAIFLYSIFSASSPLPLFYFILCKFSFILLFDSGLFALAVRLPNNIIWLWLLLLYGEISDARIFHVLRHFIFAPISAYSDGLRWGGKVVIIQTYSIVYV